ncbi:WD repeat-containing protein 75, partial [Actinomortierella ambigua]
GGTRAKENSVLLRYSFKSSSRKRLVRLLKTRLCSGLAISSDGEYLVMAGRYKLHVINIASGNGIDSGAVTENDESRFRCYLTPERITALAFHPTEGCIATGDERGRITLWYCFGKNADRPITTVMHWHAHKVASLTFTSDGSYLLSGGEESVLVIWQLATGFKQFLPRLGSEIKHITVSPDQSLYAIGHQDNSVNVIRSMDLKIKTVIQGLKFPHVGGHASSNPLNIGLIVEPRQGHVVLNGLPGTLQFYDPIKEQHIMELEISPRNKVSRADEKEIVPPQVLHCAFSSDGRWMATVDGRDDHETTPELYLKFWEYNEDAHTYVLNTRVDNPHAGQITSLHFNPRLGATAEPMVVTTSVDGKFKIWQLAQQGETRRGIEAEHAWGCRSTGFYRDMVPRCAGFSSDGSLLAVAYGQIITLWNPYLNALQGTLTMPPENRPIRHLTFVKNSPFLVAATKDHLYSWNLLTCSVWWSYQIKTERLVASSTDNTFMVTCPEAAAAAAGNGGFEHRLIVFRPTCPVPVKIETTKKKIRATTFLPDTLARSNNTNNDNQRVEAILIMNNRYDLEVLGGRTAEEVRVEAAEAVAKAAEAAKAVQEASLAKSMVTDIFGSSRAAAAAAATATANKDKKDSSSTTVRTQTSKKNPMRNPLFDAPSHVMAPVSSLFEAFMGQLLAPASSNAPVRSKDVASKSSKKKEKHADKMPNGTAHQDTEMETVEMTATAQKEESEVHMDMNLPTSLSSFFSKRLVIQS